MYNHWLFYRDCRPDMGTKALCLHFRLHTMPEKIHARLADGYALRMLGKPAKLIDTRLMPGFMVGVNANRKPDVFPAFGKSDESVMLFEFNGYSHNTLYARLLHASEHFIPITIEMMKIDMTMGIEQADFSHA